MAAKMVSLKMTAKEAKADMGYPATIGSGGKPDLPKYPYDTKIRLQTESLDKLGITPSDFKVGQVLEVTAKVEVCSTREEERQSGERNELELQITDIALNTKAIKKAKVEDEHLNSISAPAGEEADEY